MPWCEIPNPSLCYVKSRTEGQAYRLKHNIGLEVIMPLL